MEMNNKETRRVVIGITAHVDAGKTTLAEAMLYRTGRLRKLGRVDHGSAAIFDKDGFACSVLDPRERFNKNLSGMRRSYLSVSCIFHER